MHLHLLAKSETPKIRNQQPCLAHDFSSTATFPESKTNLQLGIQLGIRYIYIQQTQLFNSRINFYAKNIKRGTWRRRWGWGRACGRWRRRKWRGMGRGREGRTQSLLPLSFFSLRPFFFLLSAWLIDRIGGRRRALEGGASHPSTRDLMSMLEFF